MKICARCKKPLVQIGMIEPDAVVLHISMKEPALPVFDGVGGFVASLAIGIFIGAQIFERLPWLSLVVGFASLTLGVWLWRKPKKFYRCPGCGEKYYGGSLKHYSG